MSRESHDDKKVYVGRGLDKYKYNSPGNIDFRNECYSKCDSEYKTYKDRELQTKAKKTKFTKDLLQYLINKGFKFIDTREKDGEREMEPYNNKDDFRVILKKLSKTIREITCSKRASVHEFDKLDLNFGGDEHFLDQEERRRASDYVVRGVDKPDVTHAHRVKASRDRDGKSPIRRV